MAATNTTNSTISLDQSKYLASKLIQRSYIKLVMAGLCDMDTMKEGAGLTAYMVRYKRMNVPVSTLVEGTAPSTASTFSLEQVTVQLDQWGDFIQISDVAQLTANHQVVQEAVKLLADNAARVMDREITIVLLSGTNVQFGDGSVTTRAAITTAMKVSENTLQKARVTLVGLGAPPRGGPAGDARQQAAQGNYQNGIAYVAVCGPEVISDVMQPSTSFGTFASASTYANAKALFNAEIGQWLGFRFVETNFLPKFINIGAKTQTTVTGSGGTNAGTALTGLTMAQAITGGSLAQNKNYQWKITRKDLLRGFEEAITQVHLVTTQNSTATNTVTFTLPSGGNYVYNVYFDSVAAGGSANGDADLGLAFSNVAPGASVTVTGVTTLGATVPASINAAGDVAAIYPVFIFGEQAVAWIGFYKPKFMLTSAAAEKADPLAQFRTAAYKFFGKAVIKDQLRLLRVELASTF